ncbi:hypothetical protein ACET3X_007137 [Alternaria dauci]|uniref:Uncharacterized protein n=1 Tax=Alternaria dauci TaxID=48095 RepID=A0ABR3UIF8_9PLEO
MHFPIPKPVYGRIAQVYSQSNDPGAASLLGIPPELRNQIYGYLLIDCEPITIFDKVDDEFDDKEPIRRVSDFIGSPDIIHTCRQIYHEALGVLYGQNVFRFQYSLRHKRLHDCIIATPVKTCTEWIQDIGSCLPGLCTVTLDVGVPEIPDDHYGIGSHVHKDSRQDLPILPLLDIFWNDMASNISIEFEHTGEFRSYSFDSDDEESEESRINVEGMSNVLYELGKNDSLRLKGTRRLLKHVHVHRSGIRGTIDYRGTDYGANICREFQLSKGSSIYELVPQPNPPCLVHLGTKIILNIARLALSNYDFTYNFDTGITHGHEFGLLNVNKQLRDMVRECFLSETRFTLILGFDTSQPTKTPYRVLEHRIAESFRSFDRSHMRYCNPIEAAQDHLNKPTIVLQFQTLNHLKINAWDFLQATSIFPPRTTIIVRVHDHSDDVHVTTLGEIQRYALVFMEDFERKATPRARQSIVEVWLNKNCLPVRATVQKRHQGSEYVSSEVTEVLDMMNVTALHDAVKARQWMSYEYWNRFVCESQPERWGKRTLCGFINRLKFLCMEPHDYQ